MFVVCCLLSGDACQCKKWCRWPFFGGLCVVRRVLCALFVVRGSLCVVRCSLGVVCCSLFVVGCLWCVVYS